MTAVKKWVAAGSSAAVLAGGLFLGTPAAHADICVAPAASTAVTNLVTAADHLYDSGTHFNSLVTDPAVLGQLQTQQAVLADAIANDDTMDRAQAAWNEIQRLQETYAASTDDPAVDEAYAATSAAAANFQAVALDARAQGEVFMEDGAALLAQFQGNCDVLGTGTGSDDWTGTDSGVNQGINMQTAEESGLSTGVLAGLLAAGAAVSGAVALRVRRGRA